LYVVTEPGTEKVSFSIVSTWPNRRVSTPISAVTSGAREENVARSVAVPKSAPGGGGALVATADPTKVAATAAAISARISSCCFHSWRRRRHAHRMTALRAGTPPLRGAR
jgi:hypothetical protein